MRIGIVPGEIFGPDLLCAGGVAVRLRDRPRLEHHRVDTLTLHKPVGGRRRMQREVLFQCASLRTRRVIAYREPHQSILCTGAASPLQHDH